MKKDLLSTRKSILANMLKMFCVSAVVLMLVDGGFKAAYAQNKSGKKANVAFCSSDSGAASHPKIYREFDSRIICRGSDSGTDEKVTTPAEMYERGWKVKNFTSTYRFDQGSNGGFINNYIFEK